MFVHSPLGILAVVLVLIILFGGLGYGRFGYGAAPLGGPLAYGGGGLLVLIIILLLVF